MKKLLIGIAAAAILLIGAIPLRRFVGLRLQQKEEALKIIQTAENTGEEENRSVFDEARITRTSTNKQSALKKDVLPLMQDVVWGDDNTLYLDGDLYGFSHRIDTFLFIGTDASGNEDARDESYHGSMADFLMLLVLDYSDDTYGTIQIDRNTITSVTMTDVKTGEVVQEEDMQICTAHWYGRNPEESAVNTEETVKMFLGELEIIDGYFVLNMKDIGRINRLVGGVEVTIRDEGMESVDPAFVKGKTLTLTDEQAEKYIRARMTVGEGENKARMRRQKEYMESFFARAQERVKANPNFAQTMWKELEDTAVTDMNGNDVSRIAEMVRSGEFKGIFSPEGMVRIGMVLDDGLEHEEFYPEEGSVRDIMTDLFSAVCLEEEDEDDREDVPEDEEDISESGSLPEDFDEDIPAEDEEELTEAFTEE